MHSAQLVAKHTAQLSGMQPAYASRMAISSLRHQIRKSNLEQLVKDFGGAVALAKLICTQKSHMSAMLSGARGVGDALAARLEKKCEKDPGWMDIAHGEEPREAPRQPRGIATEGIDEEDLLVSFRKFPTEIRAELVRDFMRLALDYQSADAAAAFEKYNLKRTAASVTHKPTEPRPNEWDGRERRHRAIKVEVERRESLIERPVRDVGTAK